jgi:uncharacterized protein YcfJ
MKKTILLLALVAASSAFAQSVTHQIDTAEVLEVQAVQGPGREQCQQVQVSGAPVYQQPQQDRSYGGAIIGGIAGALLGHTVGGGTGKVVATAIGAGTGAIVGDRIDNGSGTQQPQVYQRQCTVVPGPVTYNFKALVRRTGAIVNGSMNRPVYVGQMLRAQTETATVLTE